MKKKTLLAENHLQQKNIFGFSLSWSILKFGVCVGSLCQLCEWVWTNEFVCDKKRSKWTKNVLVFSLSTKKNEEEDNALAIFNTC